MIDKIVREMLGRASWCALGGFLLIGVVTTAGCSLSRRLVLSLERELATNLLRSVQSQPDPELVRQGLPAFLLLIDGFLESNPEDPELLRTASTAYLSYSQAFLVGERAAKLHARAREYGLRLLHQRSFFREAFSKDIDTYTAALLRFDRSDVADLHAAAAAWLGWIVTQNDSMEALAELPQALALIERALALDEGHGDGSAHLFLALYCTVQPRGAGQDLEKSRIHFERAVELAGPENFLPQVLYAEYYGRATLDPAFFTERLEAVLQQDPARYPKNRLMNELAVERARLLLESKDDLF